MTRETKVVRWFVVVMAIIYALGLVLYFSMGCSTAEARPSNWDTYCMKCHGVYGSGKTPLGQRLKVKDLKDSTLDEDQVRTIIFNGKNKMPSYSKKLSSAEVDQLVEFVMNLR